MVRGEGEWKEGRERGGKDADGGWGRNGVYSISINSDL